MIKILKFICLFLMAGNLAFAQTNKELAKQKLKEAIKLEDQDGKYDEALKLILEAQQLDPGNIDYPYELAYTYNAKKEYKNAISTLEKILTHTDVYDQVYQALGNAYDFDGNPEKAIATYKLGLQKFPRSGILYTELGNMSLNKKDNENAIKYYEKGIEVEPKSAANYYRAAKLFLSADNEVWGMIYGELFMNLERNSKRTAEISKLLFDTYKSQIKFVNDTDYGVSFYKTAIIQDALNPKNLTKKLPFGSTYEVDLSLAIVGEKSITIQSLDKIRTRFIEQYFKNNHHATYPNILFDFQKEIQKAGHFEAYNHWILMMGAEKEFDQWQEENQVKWDNFIKWFGPNPIKIDENHYFSRNQYR